MSTLLSLGNCIRGALPGGWGGGIGEGRRAAYCGCQRRVSHARSSHANDTHTQTHTETQTQTVVNRKVAPKAVGQLASRAWLPICGASCYCIGTYGQPPLSGTNAVGFMLPPDAAKQQQEQQQQQEQLTFRC